MTPGARILTVAALTLVMLTPQAWAQNPAPGRARIQPLLVDPVQRALSQHPIPPLSSSQRATLDRARVLRIQGSLERSRKILLPLLAEVPHHPEVLTELADSYLTQRDYASVERLARAERRGQRDSVLLGRELSLAYQNLGRDREAVQIALQVWSVLPSEGDWANETMLRLAANDPRGIRDAMRRTVARYPGRLDLVRAQAQLEWRLGDIKAALRALAEVDHSGVTPPMRWRFASDLLLQNSSRDTSGAIDALLDLVGDRQQEVDYRMAVAHRAWELYRVRDTEPEGAPRMMRTLEDVPVEKWNPELLAGVARGLRLGGRAGEARKLLKARGDGTALPPDLALEQALAQLDEGPPQRALADLAVAAGASPEARYRYAEALFYAGQPDSAHTVYEQVAANPAAPFAGAALERMYLIEDAQPREALPVFGTIAYAEWRGEERRATALAESLYQALPRGPLWAHSALLLSRHLAAAGDARKALSPLLAVADSLPDDRLAPRARQLAGDLYLERLEDDAAAVAQYEECLARYPRAWNAAEVRRKLETLRRERRF